MFQVGDKIVHPMHGAGIVDSIVQKKVNGVVREYYVLKLPVGGMLVMIPTHNCEEIGVRPVIPGEEADRVLAAIPVLLLFFYYDEDLGEGIALSQLY